ncbi:hypothetical protein [Phyllobacterium bourgognense]|uniref:Lipoprotein n=1 Tax=Phyllobacterium bourgognense TaxID=314236 RepID=A0A368YZX0_9HYPH|nr:hypothetical protein [Phyllobacterium bourgognense]RCW83734.1 hypothetical protein C7476_105229 [Phyllobacterium bourgognense]
MKTITRGSFVFILVLGGCGTLPILPVKYPVEVSDVVNHVRCELQEASRASNFVTDGPGWSVAIGLNLKVLTDAGIGADASIESPVSSGSVIVGGKASLASTASREAALSIVENLDEPDKMSCVVRPTGVRLLGDLGVKEWISDLQTAISSTKMDMEGFSYTVEFTIEKRLSDVGPDFSLIPFRRNTIGGGFGLSGGRKDTHSLVLTFTKNEVIKVVKFKKVIGKDGVPVRVPSVVRGATNVPELLNKLDSLRLQNALQRSLR